MRVVWRIGDARFRDRFWDGTGGLYVASRWAPAGYPVIYTSTSPSLCQLEFLVHFSRRRDAEAMRLLIGKAVLGTNVSVHRVDWAELPANWMDPLAPPFRLRAMGETWLREARACVLQVPSAVSPSESNYLINPGHTDAGGIDFQAPVPFSFDARLVHRTEIQS